MSDLIVIRYEDEYKAEEVRLALIKLQKQHLVELEDAPVVVKDKEGKVKLKQAINLTSTGAVSGGFWGLLIGTLFLNPLLGVAVGAASGAVGGALSDIGVNDKFMQELGETLCPGSSALFILANKITPERVIEEIAPFGGKILQTSLSKTQESELQEILASHGLLDSQPKLS